MKFLADMGISPRTVEFLQDQGFEAVHLAEEGLERSSDSAILEKARREGRIVLTSDLDFAELVAASSASLPSVVIFRLRDMRPANVNHHLNQVLEQHQEALDKGAVASVTEGRARVRPLPIDEDDE